MFWKGEVMKFLVAFKASEKKVFKKLQKAWQKLQQEQKTIDKIRFKIFCDFQVNLTVSLKLVT